MESAFGQTDCASFVEDLVGRHVVSKYVLDPKPKIVRKIRRVGKCAIG